ncbi:MAG: prepilin-type N-terminal cleavage/methylation domain-containing protein [Planctomycetota bacterium]|nr:prepilin-type N-terminal cleavage/methylation domain-containing protein [Planctomycetota bacterium]
MKRTDARPSSGFTIVELMVAMALMIILTGVIIFIFAKVRDVTLYTEAQAQVFANARYAMDQIAQDFSGMIKTIDMEPFQDLEDQNTRMRNSHADPYEDKFDPLGGPHEERYDYSPTIREGYYTKTVRGHKIIHSADKIYFKTIATEKGRPVEGFVNYYLDEVDQERPILRRRFQWFDRERKVFLPDPARLDDVCYFVTDFKIEFYYVPYRGKSNERQGAGMWLSPIKAHERGIRDPDPRAETFVFNYHFDDRLRAGLDLEASGRGKLNVNPRDGYRATFTTTSKFPFPQLVPGDRIFIYEQVPKKPPGQIPWIVDQELTIAEIGPSGVIYFVERVIVKPEGNDTPPPVLSCNYRAGFLPSALRVTIQIKDHRAEAIRTISRVFRVMSG